MSGKKMVRSERRLSLVRNSFDTYLSTFENLTEGHKPSSFLDVGGGVGYYARAAQDAGLDAWLMDWANDALEFTRDHLGVAQTVQGDVQHCADVLHQESFDFILARHVIEHMLDPATFVSHTCRLLNPGGILQIETPNVQSREQFGHPAVMVENYRILRRSNASMSPVQATWHAFNKAVSGGNPPKHIWGFTPNGLTQLLSDAGLDVLDVRQVPAGDQTYDPLYYEQHRLADRTFVGKIYYYWERASMSFYKTNGMNLIVRAQNRQDSAE